jgi:hypothetical protein
VVTTQIYSAQYPNKKIQPQTQPAPKTYKRYEKQTAYREYINQNHYPTLKNDFLPEQSDELAHETAREALAQQRATLEHQQAYEAAVVRQTRPSRKVTVVKSRRTTKPKTVSSANTQVVETHTVVTSEQPGTEISSYEEISTLNSPSASEIQKAKAIEQDPLAPLDKDDPFNELYLNDEVLGTSGFGYNDTDPALQP